VLLLERRLIVGGAAQTEELIPGYKFSRFSYLCSLLRPVIINELNLKKRGLKFYQREISSITPTRERGKYLLMNNDLEFTKREIAKFSKKDAQNY
jgi:phytoene dehydrogenase-like protein